MSLWQHHYETKIESDMLKEISEIINQKSHTELISYRIEMVHSC